MRVRLPQQRATNLPARLLAPFASASMPVAALGIPLTVYLPNYYASHIGLSLAAVGAAFSIVRLIDIVFDPMIGVAINATRHPLRPLPALDGRGRPVADDRRVHDLHGRARSIECATWSAGCSFSMPAFRC